MPLLRLDKILSEQGLLSRSETRAYLRAGRITVDGCAVRAPEQKFDPERVSIAVDGVPLRYSAHCCYMLNKPAGVLSATEDAHGEPTVLDLFEPTIRRRGVFPVGRLDKDTEGLLLITDDGALAHRISAPRSGVVKGYIARVAAQPREGAEREFAQGLALADGTRCRPARLERMADGALRVFVSEGKFHQVKRMLAAVGSEVTALKRVTIGNLSLDETLHPSEYKLLSQEEISLIFQ